MENLPGLSGAVPHVEGDDQSFDNDESKGELTNALKYCTSLLREKGLLTDTPPENISSISIAMGEALYREILTIVEDRMIVIEDDLRMYEESDTEDVYEECKDADEEYVPEKYQPPFEHISLEYKARTVALAEAHPKWSLTTLHKKGCSRLKRKNLLKQWKDDVKKGGTHYDKWMHIDVETFKRFAEARASNEQVTNRILQQWAMAAASPYISKSFAFTASRSWMNNFKTRHKIKQRKITNYVSKKEYCKQRKSFKREL